MHGWLVREERVDSVLEVLPEAERRDLLLLLLKLHVGDQVLCREGILSFQLLNANVLHRGSHQRTMLCPVHPYLNSWSWTQILCRGIVLMGFI